jgi:hypothetical protein
MICYLIHLIADVNQNPLFLPYPPVPRESVDRDSLHLPAYGLSALKGRANRVHSHRTIQDRPSVMHFYFPNIIEPVDL